MTPVGVESAALRRADVVFAVVVNGGDHAVATEAFSPIQRRVSALQKFPRRRPR